MFAQIKEDKVNYWAEHIMSTEHFAALGQADCSYTIPVNCGKDLTQMKVPTLLDSLFI